MKGLDHERLCFSGKMANGSALSATDPNASRAFGALNQAFLNFTVTTKQRVYEVCVLSVLFYGSDRLHCKVIRSGLTPFTTGAFPLLVLDVTNQQQWVLHVTIAMRDNWGDCDGVNAKVIISRAWPYGLRMPCQRLSCLAGYLTIVYQEDLGRDGRTRFLKAGCV